MIMKYENHTNLQKNYKHLKKFPSSSHENYTNKEKQEDIPNFKINHPKEEVLNEFFDNGLNNLNDHNQLDSPSDYMLHSMLSKGIEKFKMNSSNKYTTSTNLNSKLKPTLIEKIHFLKEFCQKIDITRNSLDPNKTKRDVLNKNSKFVKKIELVKDLLIPQHIVSSRKLEKLKSSLLPLVADNFKPNSVENSKKISIISNKKFIKLAIAVLSSKGKNCEDRLMTRSIRLDKGGVIDFAHGKDFSHIRKLEFKNKKSSRPNSKDKSIKMVNMNIRLRSARLIQEWWRNLIKKYYKFRKNIILIQSCWRGYFFRKYMNEYIYYKIVLQYLLEKIWETMLNSVKTVFIKMKRKFAVKFNNRINKKSAILIQINFKKYKEKSKSKRLNFFMALLCIYEKLNFRSLRWFIKSLYQIPFKKLKVSTRSRIIKKIVLKTDKMIINRFWFIWLEHRIKLHFYIFGRILMILLKKISIKHFFNKLKQGKRIKNKILRLLKTLYIQKIRLIHRRWKNLNFNLKLNNFKEKLNNKYLKNFIREFSKKLLLHYFIYWLKLTNLSKNLFLYVSGIQKLNYAINSILFYKYVKKMISVYIKPKIKKLLNSVIRKHQENIHKILRIHFRSWLNFVRKIKFFFYPNIVKGERKIKFSILYKNFLLFKSLIGKINNKTRLNTIKFSVILKGVKNSQMKSNFNKIYKYSRNRFTKKLYLIDLLHKLYYQNFVKTAKFLKLWSYLAKYLNNKKISIIMDLNNYIKKKNKVKSFHLFFQKFMKFKSFTFKIRTIRNKLLPIKHSFLTFVLRRFFSKWIKYYLIQRSISFIVFLMNNIYIKTKISFLNKLIHKKFNIWKNLSRIINYKKLIEGERIIFNVIVNKYMNKEFLTKLIKFKKKTILKSLLNSKKKQDEKKIKKLFLRWRQSMLIDKIKILKTKFSSATIKKLLNNEINKLKSNIFHKRFNKWRCFNNSINKQIINNAQCHVDKLIVFSFKKYFKLFINHLRIKSRINVIWCLINRMYDAKRKTIIKKIQLWKEFLQKNKLEDVKSKLKILKLKYILSTRNEHILKNFFEKLKPRITLILPKLNFFSSIIKKILLKIIMKILIKHCMYLNLKVPQGISLKECLIRIGNQPKTKLKSLKNMIMKYHFMKWKKNNNIFKKLCNLSNILLKLLRNKAEKSRGQSLMRLKELRNKDIFKKVNERLLIKNLKLVYSKFSLNNLRNSFYIFKNYSKKKIYFEKIFKKFISNLLNHFKKTIFSKLNSNQKFKKILIYNQFISSKLIRYITLRECRKYSNFYFYSWKNKCSLLIKNRLRSSLLNHVVALKINKLNSHRNKNLIIKFSHWKNKWVLEKVLNTQKKNILNVNKIINFMRKRDIKFIIDRINRKSLEIKKREILNDLIKNFDSNARIFLLKSKIKQWHRIILNQDLNKGNLSKILFKNDILIKKTLVTIKDYLKKISYTKEENIVKLQACLRSKLSHKQKCFLENKNEKISNLLIKTWYLKNENIKIFFKRWWKKASLLYFNENAWKIQNFIKLNKQRHNKKLKVFRLFSNSIQLFNKKKIFKKLKEYLTRKDKIMKNLCKIFKLKKKKKIFRINGNWFKKWREHTSIIRINNVMEKAPINLKNLKKNKKFSNIFSKLSQNFQHKLKFYTVRWRKNTYNSSSIIIQMFIKNKIKIKRFNNCILRMLRIKRLLMNYFKNLKKISLTNFRKIIVQTKKIENLIGRIKKIIFNDLKKEMIIKIKEKSENLHNIFQFLDNLHKNYVIKSIRNISHFMVKISSIQYFKSIFKLHKNLLIHNLMTFADIFSKMYTISKFNKILISLKKNMILQKVKLYFNNLKENSIIKIKSKRFNLSRKCITEKMKILSKEETIPELNLSKKYFAISIIQNFLMKSKTTSKLIQMFLIRSIKSLKSKFIRTIHEFSNIWNIKKNIRRNIFKKIVNSIKIPTKSENEINQNLINVDEENNLIFKIKFHQLKKNIMIPSFKYIANLFQSIDKKWRRINKRLTSDGEVYINLVLRNYIKNKEYAHKTKMGKCLNLWRKFSNYGKIIKNVIKIQKLYKNSLYNKRNKTVRIQYVKVNYPVTKKLTNFFDILSLKSVWKKIKDEVKRRTLIKFFLFLKNKKNSSMKVFLQKFRQLYQFKKKSYLKSVYKIKKAYKNYLQRLRNNINLKKKIMKNLYLKNYAKNNNLLKAKIIYIWKKKMLNFKKEDSAKIIQIFCKNLSNKRKMNSKDDLKNLFNSHIVYKQIKPFFKGFVMTKNFNQANKHFYSFVFKSFVRKNINFNKFKLIKRLIRIPDEINKKLMKTSLIQFNNVTKQFIENHCAEKIQKKFRKTVKNKENYNKKQFLIYKFNQLNEKYMEKRKLYFLKWMGIHNENLVLKSGRVINKFVADNWDRIKIKKKYNYLAWKLDEKNCKSLIKSNVDIIKRYLQFNKICQIFKREISKKIFKSFKNEINNNNKYWKLKNIHTNFDKIIFTNLRLVFINWVNKIYKQNKLMKYFQKIEKSLSKKIKKNNFVSVIKAYRNNKLKATFDRLNLKKFMRRFKNKEKFKQKINSITKFFISTNLKFSRYTVCEKIYKLYFFRVINKFSSILNNYIMTRIKQFYSQTFFSRLNINKFAKAFFTYKEYSQSRKVPKVYNKKFSTFLTYNRLETNVDSAQGNLKLQPRITVLFNKKLSDLINDRRDNLFNELKLFYFDSKKMFAKNKLKNLLRLFVLKRLKFSLEKTSKICKLMNFLRFIKIHKIISTKIFIKSLLKRWLFFSQLQKIAKMKMQNLYKNMQFQYLDTMDHLFNDDENNSGIIKNVINYSNNNFCSLNHNDNWNFSKEKIKQRSIYFFKPLRIIKEENGDSIQNFSKLNLTSFKFQKTDFDNSQSTSHSFISEMTQSKDISNFKDIIKKNN